MTSFPALTLLFVHNYSCLYNKKKTTRPLDDMNFCSRGKKKNNLYLSHSLRPFVKYCLNHSKTKFMSSRPRVISSI